MSKVKIQGNASGTGTLTISAPNTDTDRSLTLPDGAGEILTNAEGSVESAITTQLSHRNLIINGDMQVAQRGTQETGVSTGGYYTCDRFRIDNSSLGTWTIDQSTDAPNGFSNSLKVTCTTAKATTGTNDRHQVRYYIEAQDLQHLAFGTSDAKSLTLSFWVKSNKTGNASLWIPQVDNSYKHITPSYTISSADTWEHKSISIPADTSGVINNDNGTGLQLSWIMNSGTDYTSGTNQTTWTTYADGHVNPSNLGVGGAVSDYFAITGVQLEVGSVATPFEHRSYGEELARCQRYYERYNLDHDETVPNQHTLGSFSTISYYYLSYYKKRTAPTVTSSGNFRGQGNTDTSADSSYSVTNVQTDVCRYNLNASFSGTSGQVSSLQSQTNGAYIEFDAEL